MGLRLPHKGLLSGLLAYAMLAIFLLYVPAHAFEPMTVEQAARHVEPPYQLGKSIGKGSWELINLDGRIAGYGFESEPLAPLPGFSGAPINIFVMITLEGKFIGVDLISQNEPIFVSGLGVGKLNEFLRQYKGKSITDPLVVGVPYGHKGDGSSLTYLDGVTKATASVRIAHESILAAAFAIAHDKMAGLGTPSAARPDMQYRPKLNWDDLLRDKLAFQRVVTNGEADAAFKDTLWEDDDPEAKDNPAGNYLDLYVVDIGPPSLAAAVLSDETLKKLAHFMEVSPNDEPILIIDNARHGLVSEDFVRNTSPDLLSASQDGLPLQLRDSDIEVVLKQEVPGKVAMIMRVDRRLGFNPAREWTLSARAVRKHGSFDPQAGTVDFSVTIKPDERFYIITRPAAPPLAWKQSLYDRAYDMAALSGGLLVLFALMATRMNWLAGLKNFTPVRLAILALVTGFIGWWGQGQLSIATVLGVIRSLAEGQSLAFLAYDPFSMLIWAVVLVSFVLWGRGFFCGWLCPFGAMQEFAHHLAKYAGLRQIRIPARYDAVLTKLKYVILAVMVLAIFVMPAANDYLIEIEPFKTAITTIFQRQWYFVVWAVGLLLLSMVLFKGFCRYLCPLGAFMAIGGLLRLNNWITRRAECGSPCQLCRVRCNYRAIDEKGAIGYSECFQCLDCVAIFNDPKQCVPLVLAARSRSISAKPGAAIATRQVS